MSASLVIGVIVFSVSLGIILAPLGPPGGYGDE